MGEDFNDWQCYCNAEWNVSLMTLCRKVPMKRTVLQGVFFGVSAVITPTLSQTVPRQTAMQFTDGPIRNLTIC